MTLYNYECLLGIMHIGMKFKIYGKIVSNSPNNLDLLVLLGNATFGIMAVLVEIGSQALCTLLLSFAAL